MIELDLKTYVAAGSFGDSLMVFNKLKTYDLECLTFYCAIESVCSLVQGFFDLQRLNATVVHKSNCAEFLNSIKDRNITINTVWNGIAENGKEYNDDELVVNPILDIQGVANFKPQFENYFVVQTDAGANCYHNERKHWSNIDLVKSMGLLFAKKTGLNVVFVGNKSLSDLPLEAIDITGTGYQIINYVKHAKFVIGLSGFITLASLMSGIPTVLKTENDTVTAQYYGHPAWVDRILPINEIAVDLQNIASFIQNTIS